MMDCALDLGSWTGTFEDWRAEVREATAGRTRGTMLGRRRAAPSESLRLAIDRSIESVQL